MKSLHTLLNEEIEKKTFPGAAYAIGTRDALHQGFVGRQQYESDSLPIEDDTMWDLASLSKVFGTTCVAMALHDRGDLDIETSVGEILPEFADGWKTQVKLRNLLLHNSGLPAYCGTTSAEGPPQARATVLGQPENYKTGSKTVYSCVGFVTLQTVLERITGDSLQNLHRELIQRPLDMHHTDYNPSLERRPQCAPTETLADWRKAVEDERGYERVQAEFIQGGVHDPIAFMVGGVSGNAGLFSTSDDLARLAQALLQGGEPIVRPATLKEWSRRQAEESSRGLGWDTKSPTGSSAGDKFSLKSFGDTGYTGTSVWIDPEQGIFSVLLTNRVHPDDKASVSDLRPRWHDAVAAELL